VADVVSRLQQQGIKVGCSTGFTRPMVNILEKAAKEQGMELDASVAGDEVAQGARPRPFMVYRNLDLMDAWPIQAVIKVDDTVSGIGEGLNGGCWSVGVSRYSNYMNINSYQEADDMPAAEFDRRHDETREILRKAGAHYVIDSFAEIEPVIEDVNQRLARGERP
jgi:phosphonoacetaldehyde hydrolase